MLYKIYDFVQAIYSRRANFWLFKNYIELYIILGLGQKFQAKGEKNEASFWINYKERLIYIRYFAVRDEQKKYKGVIEMSQDITEIKQIDGEKRLLEWK